LAYGGGNSTGWLKANGLITCSPDIMAQYQQTTPYLDRIRKGEKPADLPVQQPTKFKYVINLKTATTLGLTVPLTMQMARSGLPDMAQPPGFG
jgi:ABC-type uncharacterized transport system substrate-binding protein